MFTWICKTCLWVFGVIGLAGCLQAPAFNKRDTSISPGLRTISVANQSVVIAGPDGYCVDKTASRLRGETAFVLLGGCTIVSGDDHDAAPDFPGILTASVDQRGTEATTPGALDQVARFVTTDAGRAILARDGRAESVTVFGVLRQNEAVLIHLKDESGFQIQGIDPTYWRGLFELNGRLISASVLGFKDHPMQAQEGLTTLKAFMARTRQETSPVTATLVNAGNAVADQPILRKIRRLQLF